MTFLQPAALFFAALAPLIVALYFMRIRRPAVRVSTLMFWQQLTEGAQRRAFFPQRLRQVFSLLLHLLIFALILLALARPEFGKRPGVRSTAVLIDCRARMQSVGPNGVCFEQARRIAKTYLNQANAGQRMALIAIENEPRVAAGFTDADKPLLDALGALRATDGGGKAEDAVRLARDLLKSQAGDGRIVLITDRSPGISAADLETRLAAGAQARENVGITQLSARPLPNSPDIDEAIAEIENFGTARQSGSVELSRDGELLDVKPYDLAAGERRTEVYPALPAANGLTNARGWLQAHLALAKPDAFALDDNAYAIIPPRRQTRVLLVTRGNLFLEGSLKADSSVRSDELKPEAFRIEQSASFDAVILDDCLPASCANPEHLSPGNFIFLRQTPFNAVGAPLLDRPAITDVDPASPLVRALNLRDILFFRAAALTAPTEIEGWRFSSALRTQDHPLLIAGERSSQRLVAFAFGVSDSELPLRVAFPLLMRNAIEYVTRADDGSAPTSLRAGEPVLLPPGASVWIDPQMQFAPLNAHAAILHGPTAWLPLHNGFYLRREADGSESWLAVDTSDRAMSELNAPAASGGDLPTRMTLPALSQAPWVWLASAAFLLSMAEWAAFHRRRTE